MPLKPINMERRYMRAPDDMRVKDAEGIVHAVGLIASNTFGATLCLEEFTAVPLTEVPLEIANYFAPTPVADGTPVTCFGCLLEETR